MKRLGDLYTLPPDDIGYATVRDFVILAEQTNGLTESMTIELKSAVNKRNVLDAVQGLANADGGVVLVGVSEDRRGEKRLVGVPAAQHDQLVSQLCDTLPRDAIPEVIPVALPSDADRLVVVLRVDVDRVVHPVVVGGRVLIRMPGQTVPARREDVVALVHRGSTPNAVDELAGQRPLMGPDGLEFWRGDEPPQLTLRVYGGLRLSSRVLASPWLSSQCQAALHASLESSPVAGRIWAHHITYGAPSPNAWRFTERTSTRLALDGRSAVPIMPPTRPRVRGAAYVSLAGRRLEIVLALGIDPPSEGLSFPTIDLGMLHEALVALLLAQDAAAEAIAATMGSSFPAVPLRVQGWLQPADKLNLGSLLDFSRWTTDGARNIPWMSFAPTPLASRGPLDIDAVVRGWLNQLLLDSGATEFEPHLEALSLPAWSRASEPAESPANDEA